MGRGDLAFLIVVLVPFCFWMIFLWKQSRKLHEKLKLVAQQHNLIRNDKGARALCHAIHLINPHVTAGLDYLISHDRAGGDASLSEWTNAAPRPSREQIESALKELTNTYHDEEYAAMRRAEYPSVGEQLDAMYEARQGNNARLLNVDDRIRRVREKYPIDGTSL